jgi:hypothetical protein
MKIDLVEIVLINIQVALNAMKNSVFNVREILLLITECKAVQNVYFGKYLLGFMTMKLMNIPLYVLLVMLLLIIAQDVKLSMER